MCCSCIDGRRTCLQFKAFCCSQCCFSVFPCSFCIIFYIYKQRVCYNSSIIIYCCGINILCATVNQVVAVGYAVCLHAVCFCRSIENVVAYSYIFYNASFPVRGRSQCYRVIAVCPVHGVVVNLYAVGTVFSSAKTDHRCAVIQTVIYADIVSCNIVYSCSRSRTKHQESTIVIMAVVVLIQTVL